METSGADGAWGSPTQVTREQYVHFVTLAHERGDPADWSGFRVKLLAALNAAWGLDTRWGHRTAAQNDWVTAQRQRRTLDVLDDLRAEIDPASDWPGFFDELWQARATIRADVIPPKQPAETSAATVRTAAPSCGTAGRRPHPLSQRGARCVRRPRRSGRPL